MLIPLLAVLWVWQLDVPLERIQDPAVWRAGQAAVLEEDGREFVRLGGGADVPTAWLLGSDFDEGTIEVDLRGRNLRGQSFVGIAIRGKADDVRDVVYFRPFNFQDAERRGHSVQYESRPNFGWDQLRALHPDKYEAAINPAPQPEAWLHARIVIEGRQIRVFVNHATTPSLTVTELTERKGGMIGLNGMNADYCNLRLFPKAHK